MFDIEIMFWILKLWICEDAWRVKLTLLPLDSCTDLEHDPVFANHGGVTRVGQWRARALDATFRARHIAIKQKPKQNKPKSKTKSKTKNKKQNKTKQNQQQQQQTNNTASKLVQSPQARCQSLAGNSNIIVTRIKITQKTKLH